MIDKLHRILVSPKKTALNLLYVLFFLIFAQIVVLIMQYGLGHGRLFGLNALFHFDVEQNIPTLFNTVLLLIVSCLFFVIWRLKKNSPDKKYVWVWLLFTFIFLFLSVDEFCMIHELLSEPVHEGLNTSGFLYFAWVIPYGIAAIVILAFFIPIWWKMENKNRILFALSAILYLTGSVLLEMLAGRQFEATGDQVNLTISIFSAIEESFEMGGLILLIYTLMLLIIIEHEWASVVLISSKPETESST